MPDFYTLYLVVLIAGLSHCVLWGAILYRYPSLAGAGHWLAGSLAYVAGGTILAADGGTGSFVTTVAGNGAVILAFHLNGIGLRRLHGDAPGWGLCALLTAASVLAMTATFRLWWGRNPVYVVAQSIPLAMSVVYLVRHRRQELGALISSGALGVAIAAHAVVAAVVMAQLVGVASAVSVAPVAAIDLLAFIFAGITWNFGFVVSAVDKLTAEIERLAAEDDLTGLVNRRAFMRELAADCSNATRNGPHSA